MNIKNNIKCIYSAIGEKSINNELFVLIIIPIFVTLASIFGIVFVGIWYIIPTCLSSISEFSTLYFIFSVSTTMALSLITLIGFNVWINKEEKK